MKNRKLFDKSVVISLALTAVAAICFVSADAMTWPLVRGFGIGAGALVLSLYCLCRAMESAPDLSRVVTFYCLHLAAEFGVVLLALFVPVYSPLGALIPQLFCVPVLAVCFFLEK